MNSRTWLAVILSCLVWFVYMRWFAPVPPTPLHQDSIESVQSATGQTPTQAVPGTPAAANTGSNALLPAGFVPAESLRKSTQDLEIGFSAPGGKIASFVTRTHQQTMDKGAPYLSMMTPQDNAWSLGTLFSDKVLAAELDSQTYTMQDRGTSVVMTRQIPGSLSIYKEYTLTDGHYVDWKLEIKNLDAKHSDWGFLYVPIGQLGAEYNAEQPLKALEVVSYQDGSVTRHPINDLEKIEWKQGKTGWLSFGNRYFATALIPSGSINPDVGFVKDGTWHGGILRFPLIFKEGTNALTFNFKVFAGPKDYALLKQVEGLGSLIDYGTFSFLAFPLLELLRFFYRFVGNYGLSIILLTLLVRALFYPLSLKGYRSMKAMQKLQPQIAALKEKYKDDTAKFGQEQMALFKTHKVNPAGGCLPMLVQLPVFIALYAVLNSSVELFHAPFYGWIVDLSSKDPFYVFPVLMGISMFVQQKMTPMAGMDPMQQKVLLIMPIVFSFIMLNLPSGLTIYIFLSTLLGILQQVLMNRHNDTASSVPLATASGPGSK